MASVLSSGVAFGIIIGFIVFLSIIIYYSIYFWREKRRFKKEYPQGKIIEPAPLKEEKKESDIDVTDAETIADEKRPDGGEDGGDEPAVAGEGQPARTIPAEGLDNGRGKLEDINPARTVRNKPKFKLNKPATISDERDSGKAWRRGY